MFIAVKTPSGRFFASSSLHHHCSMELSGPVLAKFQVTQLEAHIA
jgi:hypothetical protein